jgi:hypothetical protein
MRKRAESNTRALLTRVLAKFGFQTIDLEFTDGGPLTFKSYE